LEARTPVEINNRPGLRAVAYRLGTHSRFKESMLAALSATQKRPALAKLLTREDDDLSIALIDAWATVAEVLAFYQERIANESYLRTATERRSIAYLAELIGYHLKPGVAATTYLSFTVDEGADSAQVDKGTRVQSLPTDGGMPQTFETVESIVARADWNKIKPRLTQPQKLSKDMDSLTVKGVDTNIQVGDSLLIVYEGGKTPVVKKVLAVHADAKAGTTRVDFVQSEQVKPQTYQKKVYQKGTYITDKVSLTEKVVTQYMIGKSWIAADLFALANYQNWSYKELTASIDKVVKSPTPPTKTEVHVFRKRAAVFGHNAPQFIYVKESLPKGTKSWENRKLSQDVKGSKYYLYLDSTYPEISVGSWVALSSPSAGPTTYKVKKVEEVSRADFTLSARVTRLTLDHNTNFSTLKMRATAVLAQSEALELVEVPIPDDVQGETIQLASSEGLEGLKAGQKVIVSGTPRSNPGVTKREVVTIDEVRVEDGHIVLEFKRSLAYKYLRKSVTLFGNVAKATHGETHQEVLGSGDGRKTRQRFSLKNKPLTYVSASTSSGSQSTLEVRVDDLLWKEAPDLARLKSNDREYIVRINDEGGTKVIFGDGEHGARPPSGTENITAKYRSGSGLKGNLDAETLTLLAKRPAGVREVTNPVPAAGGAEAESGANARRNAPLSVLTLDRIVSLQDYEDFARAFVGIAKARATRAWQGQTQAVHLTVAGPKGVAIPEGGTTHQDLLEAMGKAGDPNTPLQVDSFSAVRFQIEAKVKVHSDHLRKKVLADIESKLRSHFSFEARRFGQPVAINEMMAVIQNVPGVVAVDVDALFRTGESRAWNALLPAALPRPGVELKTLKPAELLTLDPRPITWGVMK
jgi:predicted phage baseplate assembly protein